MIPLPTIATRIAAYEMAYRMQASVPEVPPPPVLDPDGVRSGGGRDPARHDRGVHPLPGSRCGGSAML